MAGFPAGGVDQEAVSGMLVSLSSASTNNVEKIQRNIGKNYSLKPWNSWAVQKQSLGWIGLSAGAFKLEAIGGLEGYTIMTMPSRCTGDSEHELPSSVVGTRSTPRIVEYTLWEMSNGYGRS